MQDDNTIVVLEGDETGQELLGEALRVRASARLASVFVSEVENDHGLCTAETVSSPLTVMPLETLAIVVRVDWAEAASELEP